MRHVPVARAVPAAASDVSSSPADPVVTRAISSKERFYNLLLNVGGNVSANDVARIDGELYELLRRSNNRIQAELVTSGRIVRVSPGVFRTS